MSEETNAETHLPEKANINIDDVQATIKEVIQIEGAEWPDDKEVSITVEFMVVPKTMNINIRKKK